MVELPTSNMVEVPREVTDALIRELFLRGAIQPPVKKKKYVSWEKQYAREFAATYFPRELAWFRHEVGALPVGVNVKMFDRTRRWADLIIYKIDEVLIFEFKMKPSISAISQLYSYIELFPETPEFNKIRSLPVKGFVVTTREDSAVQSLCEKWGLGYVIFRPSFYDEWARLNILHEKEFSA